MQCSFQATSRQRGEEKEYRCPDCDTVVWTTFPAKMIHAVCMRVSKPGNLLDRIVLTQPKGPKYRTEKEIRYLFETYCQSNKCGQFGGKVCKEYAGCHGTKIWAQTFRQRALGCRYWTIPDLPPLYEQARNLAASVANFACDGLAAVDEQEYQRRLTICAGKQPPTDGLGRHFVLLRVLFWWVKDIVAYYVCKALRRKNIKDPRACEYYAGKRCLECGCFVVFKAYAKAFECRLGRWEVNGD